MAVGGGGVPAKLAKHLANYAFLLQWTEKRIKGSFTQVVRLSADTVVVSSVI